MLLSRSAIRTAVARLAFAAALSVIASGAESAAPVTLNWLGGSAPDTPAAVSWGVPWPKGAVQRDTAMRLTSANGTAVDVQTWPVAYWPDGSIKWSGHSIAAT